MTTLLQHLARIELVCRHPQKLADFYRTGLGFSLAGEFSFAGPAFSRLIAIPDATASGVTLRLGDQEIALIAIRPAGTPYPTDVTGPDPLFQHFAIVVADMQQAYARLCATTGWTAISARGPQLLPASSGGVRAFKFRDPEGHPLELLAFAENAIPAAWQRPSKENCLGIDHSAISVADSAVSMAFYQSLGLHRGGGSHNAGPEQSNLDGIVDAVVDVTALALPDGSPPHVELLGYRRHKPTVAGQRSNDITATRLVFTVAHADALAGLCANHRNALVSGPIEFADGTVRALLRDPDGHLIELEASR